MQNYVKRTQHFANIGLLNFRALWVLKEYFNANTKSGGGPNYLVQSEHEQNTVIYWGKDEVDGWIEHLKKNDDIKKEGAEIAHLKLQKELDIPILSLTNRYVSKL
jgi:hypothetical protein